jgi:protein SCO1/2
MSHKPYVIGLATLGLAIAGTVIVAGVLLRPANRAAGTPTTAALAAPTPSATPTPFAVPGRYDYPTAAPAPALALIDQDGQAFDLASVRGTPVLVYFGYTHCPDVCPATVGVLNQVIGRAGRPVRAIIVTVDPERDTPAALKSYLEYLPTAYIGLTGSATAIKTAADAWGVTYARIDTGSASGYGMAHTAEVYLIDADGLLRTHYPFGTAAPAILADLARIASR